MRPHMFRLRDIVLNVVNGHFEYTAYPVGVLKVGDLQYVNSFLARKIQIPGLGDGIYRMSFNVAYGYFTGYMENFLDDLIKPKISTLRHPPWSSLMVCICPLKVVAEESYKKI